MKKQSLEKLRLSTSKEKISVANEILKSILYYGDLSDRTSTFKYTLYYGYKEKHLRDLNVVFNKLECVKEFVRKMPQYHLNYINLCDEYGEIIASGINPILAVE